MRIEYKEKILNNAVIDPAHVVEVVCAQCKFDVAEEDLSLTTCPNCGEDLTLKKSVGIQVTPLPPIFGSTM
jgi:Zn finger protein HypA/HybF involved in hydrogenase expression